MFLLILPFIYNFLICKKIKYFSFMINLIDREMLIFEDFLNGVVVNFRVDLFHALIF